MIKTTTILNFQSHKKTVLKWHERVNVLIGESDSGKSAIMKVLRAILTNKSSGDEFISWWAKYFLIKTEIDERLIRRRKGDKNEYYLDEKVYKAFGKGIPEEIEKLINLSDVNIQNQLDNPFLLLNSSGEVARYFNKIVNLDVIDRSLQNMTKRRSLEKRDLELKREERKRLEKDLKSYDWIVKAEDKLKKLEQTQSSIKKMKQQIFDINELVSQIEELNTKKNKLKKLLKSEDKLNSMIKLEEEIYSDLEKIDEIEDLISEIEDLTSKKEKLSGLMKAEPEIFRLIKLGKEVRDLKNERAEISDIIEKIELSIQKRTKLEEEKKQLEKDLKELMPDICPLCEQEVKDGHFH